MKHDGGIMTLDASFNKRELDKPEYLPSNL